MTELWWLSLELLPSLCFKLLHGAVNTMSYSLVLTQDVWMLNIAAVLKAEQLIVPRVSTV